MRLKNRFSLLSLMMILSILFSLNPSAAAAQAPTPPEMEATPLNTIHGTVLVEGGAVPALAQVIAWKNNQHAVSPLGVDGSYSLAVGAGDWWVTVAPTAPGGTSPDWVYTGEAQLAHFDANPDPVTPVLGMDFTVTPADAVIYGVLNDPSGGTAFAAPNRVWVRAQNQEGEGNTVLADPLTGAFSINVLPGTTLIKLTFENPLWAPPLTLAGSEWYIAGGASQDAGTLALLEKKAKIAGVVTDELANPVVDITVRAWRVDGSLVVKAKTNASGEYMLPVLPGVWEVQVVPSASSPLVAAQSPQRVMLPHETSAAVRNLGVLTADVTVNGTVVDGQGTPVPGLYGHIFALYPEDDRWPQFGTGAPIINSAFTLKLSSALSGFYKLKSSFGVTVGYTAISAIPLTVQPGQTYTVTLPVAANNSTISGHLIDLSTNLPKTGLPASIYGASNSGAVKRDRVNPLDGSYLINAVSTDTSGNGGTFWWVKAFVDPTTGWTVLQPRTHKVFLPYNEGEGADVVSDFLVAEVNAVIRGTVRDANGMPAAGVRVTVTERGMGGGAAFRRWTETNADGFYRIPVPAGRYRVTADFRNWISPVPVNLFAVANHAVTANLMFRQKDAIISGTVSYAGAPHAAFIRAFSNTGAHVVGLAGLDGAYEIGVNSGDIWHVQAVSEEGDLFLRSRRAEVRTVLGANPGIDLELLEVGRLPKAVVLTFDAAQNQTLTLSNGAQIIVPAGALAASGEVSISARPLVELSDNGGADPVSFGYRLHAFGADLQPIDRFRSALTLVMPFTAQQLIDLGVTPLQLIPSYWDQASGSWKDVPNYSITLYADGSGSLNLSVEHFTDYAMLKDAMPYTVFMPVLTSGE